MPGHDFLQRKRAHEGWCAYLHAAARNRHLCARVPLYFPAATIISCSFTVAAPHVPDETRDWPSLARAQLSSSVLCTTLRRRQVLSSLRARFHHQLSTGPRLVDSQVTLKGFFYFILHTDAWTVRHESQAAGALLLFCFWRARAGAIPTERMPGG